MPDTDKTVFISYRRNVSSFIARAIFQDLRQHDYDVFMDVETIDSGEFDRIILNQIAARAHFVLILTSGSLERCAEPGDWLRCEIEEAMRLQRNIVPLLANGFAFDAISAKYLTGDLAKLSKYNALNVPHDFFNEAMERLRTRFLKQPVYVTITPAPTADLPKVERKQAEVAQLPRPTQEQLNAEEYFNRALKRLEMDRIGKIADYTEAIRLNPKYAYAYYNRAREYQLKGDMNNAYDDALAATRLNPDYAEAYIILGSVQLNRREFNKAILEYSKAVHLNPTLTEGYYNRGLACHLSEDLEGAIASYTEAIRLDPTRDVMAYKNRGDVYRLKSNIREALADYQQYLRYGGGRLHGDQLEVENLIKELKKHLNP